MTLGSSGDRKVQDDREEQAANVLNAVMLKGIAGAVLAVGLVAGPVGLWMLWRFAAALWAAGATTDWMDLASAVTFLFVGIQALRIGLGMIRRRSTPLMKR